MELDNHIYGQIGYTWAQIREARQRLLEKTDLWYFKDRWDGLSSAAKGQLNSFRQTLRELPQSHNTPDEAANSFPIAEDWF